MEFKNIFEKLENNLEITKEECIYLLETNEFSEEYYKLLYLANNFARKQFNNKGIIFAQIGIDAQKCDVNCKFCSLAKDSFHDETKTIKPIEEVIEEVKLLVKEGCDEIFLMTTANFNQKTFLSYGKEIKSIIPENMNLVVNLGDFDYDYGKQLKELGIKGAYHICRLGEGEDTDVSIERRVETLKAIKESGLELYYCVEPIGPEHTNDAIATEIFRPLDYPVTVMAVMKRVAVEGTQCVERGEISSARLALIAAVSTLVVRPERAMGVHEPVEVCLMAGCNQIYAEVGCNPRDLEKDTKLNRGFSVEKAKKMLKNMNWD